MPSEEIAIVESSMPNAAGLWHWHAPMLRKAGVKAGVGKRIVVDTPRRFLAFVPQA